MNTLKLVQQPFVFGCDEITPFVVVAWFGKLVGQVVPNQALHENNQILSMTI